MRSGIRMGIVVGWAVCSGATAASASTAWLGGFTPVAVGESARAGWVNPAQIPFSRQSSVALEAVWVDGVADGLSPGEMTYLSAGIGTNLAAYGLQRNFAAGDGEADWTLSAARPFAFGARSFLGLGLEWEKGDSSDLVATAGFTTLLGRDLHVGVSVENALEAGDTRPRLWRGGLAWTRPRFGYLSWDIVHADEGDAVNWFGFRLERLQAVNLSFHANLDGDFVAAVGLGASHHAVQGGVRQVDSARDARFLAWDWRPRPASTRSR